MKILLDENVAFNIKDFLISIGYQVDHIKSVAREGLLNGEVYLMAKKRYQLFVTNDRHFLNFRAFSPTRTLGIIFLRVSMANPKDQVEALQLLFSKKQPEALINHLTILRKIEYKIH